MSMTVDEAIDRRRLRRKLSFWRIAAIALAAIGLIAVAMWSSGAGEGQIEHVARVKISGTIAQDDELLQRLADIRKSARVKGVILAIDSPGGTTAGGESIYEAVRLLAKEKPVVSEIGTLGASAGYMIAAAADHIVARQSSIVGSIGVLVQYPDVTALMDKVGVKLEEVKSSPLKAEPSPFNPTTEEERAAVRSMIMDMYDWFVGIVDERRPLDRAQVLALADGKVFTGRQALERKLIDAVGGEDQSVAWLESKGVPKGLEVIEWKKKAPGGLAGLFRDTSAQSSDLTAFARALAREFGVERIFLDGFVSLWQPE